MRANLPLDKRRVELLASFLIAIIQQNTSNLARLANVLDLSAKQESKYRRLKRFLTDASLDYTIFAKLMVAILKPSGKYILALDRTEWKYGKIWVNILTLSMVVGNTSIPLFWQTLNRKGNSTLAEKRAIIDRYLEVFGVANIEYFCADREFDGLEFVKYLEKKRVPFRLRVKVSMPITNKNGVPMKCGKLLRTLKIGENYKIKRARKYGGVKVYVEVERGRDTKESVIVIASEKSGQILLEYKRRWAIETRVSEPEKSRIRVGRDAPDESRKNRQAIWSVSLSGGVGSQNRRVGKRGKRNRDQEQRQSAEKFIQARMRDYPRSLV